MVDINVALWEPVIHMGWQEDRIQSAVNKRPCEKPAFYMKRSIKRTDPWSDMDVLGLNGEHFAIGLLIIDNITCVQCNNPVRHSDIQTTLQRIWKEYENAK